MPNKQYVKGRRKEYRIMQQERNKGCIVIRSAGSHSPVDLVSIDTLRRTIKLIQCKSDNLPNSTKLKLEEQYKHLNNTFFVYFTVL